MTDIEITVNDHGEVYLSSNILGVRGENNSRQLVIDAPVYDGATYEVWFEIGGDTSYSMLVTNGKCAVPASVLAGSTVTLQWVAVKGRTVMRKSNKFTMYVLESIDDTNLPIPTYEQAQTVLQQINSLIDSDGSKNDVFVKSSSNGNSAEWKSLKNLARQTAFAQSYVLEWHNTPTVEQNVVNMSIVKAFARAEYPKTLLLKIVLGTNEKYLNASAIIVNESTYTVMFFGADPSLISDVICKKIVANIDTDEYTQYNYNDYHYFLDSNKAKLNSVEEGAQRNKIETVKLNNEPITVIDGAVNVNVPLVKTCVLQWYNNPTSEQINANVSAVNEFAAADYPKMLLLKVNVNGVEKYLNSSVVSVNGSVYTVMFSGADTSVVAGTVCRKIIVDVNSNSYEQYSYTEYNYFLDSDKAKLNSIEEGAEVNTIESIKVNGQTVSVVNKEANIEIPIIQDACTESQVMQIVNDAISNIIDADEVNY